MALSKEALLQWADPAVNEFVGHAFSEEHLAEIHTEVTAARRAFLWQAAHDQLNGGTAESHPAPTEEVDFNKLPLKLHINRDESIQLGMNWHPGFTESCHQVKQYWNRIAESYAEHMGFRPWATKHDDFYADSMANFRRFVEKSERISRLGFPIHMLMNGQQHVYPAALDLEPIREYAKDRAITDMHGVYWTPIGYWPKIVELKTKLDGARGHEQYADVVQELDEKLYVAPYIPDEVAASPHYLNHDHFWRTATELGYKERAATQAFRYVASWFCQDKRTLNDYFLPPPQSRRPGAIFFRIEPLEELRDQLDFIGKKGYLPEIIDELLEPSQPVGAYDHLVFDE